MPGCSEAHLVWAVPFCRQVLQVMNPPRRRIVVFKGGGYIYAEMEAMIEAAGGCNISFCPQLLYCTVLHINSSIGNAAQQLPVTSHPQLANSCIVVAAGVARCWAGDCLPAAAWCGSVDRIWK